MQNFLLVWKKPYTQKGFFIGLCDTLLKLVTLVLWGNLVYILLALLIESWVTDYNPLNKLWWFSYCFSIFFGGTWLAYIAFFMRDYMEE